MNSAAIAASSRTKFLVIGGYGAVGRIVSSNLAHTYPGQVIVAGRNLKAARALAKGLAGRAEARAFDVRNAAALGEALRDARVVINCVEAANREVAEACLLHGARFLDVSATTAVLDNLESLHSKAREQETTGVLSVGFAPGVTNLLALEAHETLGGADTIEIAVLLGVGDEHGPDAMRWLLEGTHSLGEAVDIFFPPPFRRRTAYGFDFSDQHAIGRTLDVPHVRTRLCFEPAFMTRLLPLTGAIGFPSLARKAGLLPRLAKLLSALRFGSNVCLAQAEARAADKATKVWLVGQRQSIATAGTAAFVARHLYEGSPPPGVFHIHELFAPQQLWDELKKDGFAVGLQRCSRSRTL